MISNNFPKLAAVCAALAPFASAYIVDYTVYDRVSPLVVPDCNPPYAQSGAFLTGAGHEPPSGCMNIALPSYWASIGFIATTPTDVCTLNFFTESDCEGTIDSATGTGLSFLPQAGPQSGCMPLFDTTSLTQVPAKSFQVVCPGDV